MSTNKTNWKVISIIITLSLTALAIYVGYKNHKKEGFWSGVLAMLLLSTYILVNQDSSKIAIGPVSLEATPPAPQPS